MFDRVIAGGGARSAGSASSPGEGAAMRRYTLVIEPAAHPEARRQLVVEARDEGDAYDRAADHASAELPYRCTFAIAKIEGIADSV